MQSSLTHQTATRKLLELTIPVSEVTADYNAIVTQLASKVKIPGFRPGKASKEVILSNYEREIKSEIIETLVKRHFMNATSSAGITPISSPTIEKAELSESVDSIINVSFDVAPEVNIPQYKELTISKIKRGISDNDVDEQLDYICEKVAKFIPVENGVAELNHYVTVDIKVKPQRLKTVSYKDQVIQLAPDRPFDAEILNMRVGESKHFSLTLPNDNNDNAPDQIVSYEVLVKDLRTRELPTIDDEFAKDIGPYNNLEELRAAVHKDLENLAEKDSISRAHQEILEKLLANSESFEVPDSMVSLQLNDYCRDFAKMASNQGVDPKTIDWNAFRQNRITEAQRSIRSGYILQAIGNQENIQANEDDVNAEIVAMMKKHNIQQTFEAFKKRLDEDGNTDEIKGRVRTYNILNYILDISNVIEEILDKDAFNKRLTSEQQNTNSSSNNNPNKESTELNADNQSKCNCDDSSESTECCHH